MTIRWPGSAVAPKGPALLEEIDALLVQQLQRDGRASFEALGRAVGLTRTAARARVSRLLDRGVIRVAALRDTSVGRPAGRDRARIRRRHRLGAGRGARHRRARLGGLRVGRVRAVPRDRGPAQPGEAALAADLDWLRARPGIRGLEVVRALALVRDAYRPARVPAPVIVDDVDGVLIGGLERDGRMSYAGLAALAGLSPAATRSRVLRLIRSGAVHVTVLVDAGHTGRLARAGLGITVRGPAQDIAEQVGGVPDVTYVLTGTGRFDVIAAADASSETSLLRAIERIRALRGVDRVQSWRHLQIVKERYARVTPLGRG